MGFIGSRGCVIGGILCPLALGAVIGGSVMIAAGTGSYAEIDLWYSVPLCPRDTPAEASPSPPPNDTVYVSRGSAGASTTLCGQQSSAQTVKFYVDSELFDSSKTYFPVAYFPNTLTFEKIDMVLISAWNQPLVVYSAEPITNSSSAAATRRLLKGSIGGGGRSSGGSSTGRGGSSRGRGPSSDRARGTSNYRTGSGSTRSVNYRSTSRSTYLSWGGSGGHRTRYGRRGSNVVKDDTVVFIYSPIGIGIRNDFDPSSPTSTCPANGTEGKYQYSSTAASDIPSSCTIAQEGCETVLLVDQNKLGFGNQTASKRTGCDKPESHCTNFVPSNLGFMTLLVTVRVRLSDTCPDGGATAVWPHFFITFQTTDGTDPSSGLVGGGIALVVIGSIAIFSSLFVCIFLRSTSCDACGRCHKPRFGYRRGQRGSSGAEMVIRFHPTPYGQGTSSATPHSEPGKPTVATDCPSGALPPHLICDSEPFIHRNGDHSSLYSRLPTHVTLLDLHSNDITSLHGVDRFGSLGGLQVANNELTGLDGLATTQTLVWLDASSNAITSLKECASCNLVWLNVMDNDVRVLDPQLLPNLRCLLAGNNRITSIAANVHTRVPSLAILDLNNNDLVRLDGIQHLTSLMELDLQSNDISSAGPLLELIPNCPNLRYLNVSDNNLKRGDVGRLQDALQTHLPDCTLVQDTIRAAEGGV